jgi:phosphoribosylamine--glycine ligase
LIRWKKEQSVCVVMAAGGYPGDYKKGDEISGLDAAAEHAVVFHAGTALKDGKVVTAGGRALGVTGIGKDLRAAVDNAYAAVKKISWKDSFYRKDIAYRALK